MDEEEADGTSRVIRIIQPTYETDPSIDGRFIPAQIQRECEPIVKTHLEGFTWNAESRTANTTAAQSLVTAIMNRLQELDLPRYKIVIQLSLGENMGQAVRVGSQSLWESEVDNTAEITHFTESVWASLVIIGYYTH